MPRYFADTVEEAIKLAVRGTKVPHGPKRSSPEELRQCGEFIIEFDELERDLRNFERAYRNYLSSIESLKSERFASVVTLITGAVALALPLARLALLFRTYKTIRRLLRLAQTTARSASLLQQLDLAINLVLEIVGVTAAITAATRLQEIPSEVQSLETGAARLSSSIENHRDRLEDLRDTIVESNCGGLDPHRRFS